MFVGCYVSCLVVWLFGLLMVGSPVGKYVGW